MKLATEVPESAAPTARGGNGDQLIVHAPLRGGWFHPTSVSEIVDGVEWEGVFYWYFASKDDLFIEILRAAQQTSAGPRWRAIGASIRWRPSRPGYAQAYWMADNPDLRPVRVRPHRRDLRPGDRAAASASSSPTRWRHRGRAGPDTLAIPEALKHAILGVTNQLVMVYLPRLRRARTRGGRRARGVDLPQASPAPSDRSVSDRRRRSAGGRGCCASDHPIPSPGTERATTAEPSTAMPPDPRAVEVRSRSGMKPAGPTRGGSGAG
ncbi:MAG: helix-turn-helix domain-containing protein [Microthrixaceae bacterium]